MNLLPAEKCDLDSIVAEIRVGKMVHFSGIKKRAVFQDDRKLGVIVYPCLTSLLKAQGA